MTAHRPCVVIVLTSPDHTGLVQAGGLQALHEPLRLISGFKPKRFIKIFRQNVAALHFGPADLCGNVKIFFLAFGFVSSSRVARRT